MQKATGMVLLLLFLPAAGAASAAPWYAGALDLWQRYRAHDWYEHKAQKQLGQAVHRLAQSGQPRQLALAALLASDWARSNAVPAAAPIKTIKPKPPIASPERIALWQQSAMQQATADDVLLLVLLSVCQRSQGQWLRNEALRRWQRLEADNLAPLLYQRPLPAAELLGAAATRGRLAQHGYPLQRWMYQSLRAQLADAPESAVALLVIGAWVGSLSPDLSNLLQTCRAEQGIGAPYQKPCRHVGALLHGQSESLLLKAAGIALLKKQATDSAEIKRLDKERAHIDWLLRQGAANKKLQDYLYILQDSAINGEQEELESLLRRAGLPITDSSGN